MWTAPADTLAFTKVSTLGVKCLLWSGDSLYACADEFKDTHVLALHVHGPGMFHSATKQIKTAADLKGLKVRGGSREMDMMLKQAGASVITLPSNEIYAAMQTGA